MFRHVGFPNWIKARDRLSLKVVRHFALFIRVHTLPAILSSIFFLELRFGEVLLWHDKCACAAVFTSIGKFSQQGSLGCGLTNTRIVVFRFAVDVCGLTNATVVAFNFVVFRDLRWSCRLRGDFGWSCRGSLLQSF